MVDAATANLDGRSFIAAPGSAGPVEWAKSEGLVRYADAVAAMEARVAGIAAGSANERVWLVEHPALYTGGTSARPCDLIDPDRFPVYPSGRGGQFTYHGPGQRVAYVMLDLNRRRRDLRAFVRALEEWLIQSLADLGVDAAARSDRVGVWVPRAKRDDPFEDKIAAIGLRLRRWVSFHGISLNVDPDLSHYAGIVPCGIAGHGVTSLAALGRKARMDEVDLVLRRRFEGIFGPTFAV